MSRLKQHHQLYNKKWETNYGRPLRNGDKGYMNLGLEYGSKTLSEIDDALQIFMLNAFFCVVFNLN